MYRPSLAVKAFGRRLRGWIQGFAELRWVRLAAARAASAVLLPSGLQEAFSLNSVEACHRLFTGC